MSEQRPIPAPPDPSPGPGPTPSGGLPPGDCPPTTPPLSGRGPRPGAALHRPPAAAAGFTPEQRLLILDAWRRSGLPAGDFAPLVGLARHTFYA